MQPSYRTAPEAPRPVVIVYRAQPVWAALLVTSIMMGMLVVIAVLALGLSRDVTLDLSRADDTCVITRTYPVVGDVRETHRLSSIRGTQLVVSHGKHGSVSYAVKLTTDQDPIGISALDAQLAERSPQKRQIDAFLAGTAPSLHLVYDTGSASGFFPVLFAIIPESYELGELRAVVVRSETGRKGRRVHKVVLVLGSGQNVALLPVATNVYAHHARAAEQIRSALQVVGVPVGAEG